MGMQTGGAAISISASERGHKAQKMVVDKECNRLSSDRQNKALFVHSACRTRLAMEKAAAEERDAVAASMLSEEEEAALYKSKRTINHWWVEELFMASSKDQADLDCLRSNPTSLEAALGLKPFLNYIEKWEVRVLKTKSPQTKKMLHGKYHNMFLRIQEQGHAPVDRAIVDFVWEAAKECHGRYKHEYHVLTNLITAKKKGGGAGYDFVGAAGYKSGAKRKGAGGKGSRKKVKGGGGRKEDDDDDGEGFLEGAGPQNKLLSLRIDDRLHGYIAESPWHDHNSVVLRQRTDGLPEDEEQEEEEQQEEQEAEKGGEEESGNEEGEEEGGGRRWSKSPLGGMRLTSTRYGDVSGGAGKGLVNRTLGMGSRLGTRSFKYD